MHNRKLVIGGVALVKARLKHTIPALGKVRDELETELIASNFFANAPFSWISLIIRYGLKNSFNPPASQRINKKDGDLAISVEIDTHLLLRSDLETTTTLFRIVLIESLICTGREYDLPITELEHFRAKLPSLGDFPL